MQIAEEKLLTSQSKETWLKWQKFFFQVTFYDNFLSVLVKHINNDSGAWLLATLAVLLLGMGVGGMYFTFKHFMKSPLCNSKARCENIKTISIIVWIKKFKFWKQKYLIDYQKKYFKNSLVGKTVIITGGTSGLGRETALELSLKGARIILVSR